MANEDFATMTAGVLTPPGDLTPSQLVCWEEIVASVGGLRERNRTLVRVAAESGARYMLAAKIVDARLADGSIEGLISVSENGAERVDPRVSLMMTFQTKYEAALKQLGASPTTLLKGLS